MSGSTVLVGIDGSASALGAVEWAAREAHDRGLRLRIVHATEWPEGTLDPNAVLARRIAATEAGSSYREDLARVAREQLSEAETTARARFPLLEIEVALVEGRPVDVLRAEAERARLVVVGSRGLGGFAKLLVGSVAVGLAAEAPCPVVVVRGDLADRSDAPVLVGYDGREANAPVVSFAHAEAAARGVPLEVLFAWRDSYEVPDDVEVAEEAQRYLEARLVDLRLENGDVEVRGIVASDRPASALVEGSAAAQLVVVGSRGRNVLGGFALGSVSQALLHHADCPVAVVGPVARAEDR